MKKIILGISLMVFILGQAVCYAASQEPNLVGTWIVQAEGVTLLKGTDLSKHNREGASLDKDGTVKKIETVSPDMTIIITDQVGRVFYGKKVTAKTSEKFAGVIGFDKKSIHYVDEDGFCDGVYNEKNDTIEYVYKHNTVNDSVIIIGTLTRKK